MTADAQIPLPRGAKSALGVVTQATRNVNNLIIKLRHYWSSPVVFKISGTGVDASMVYEQCILFN